MLVAFLLAAALFGTPVKVGQGGRAMALCLEGNRLYAGEGDRVCVYDVREPLKPAFLGGVGGLGEIRQIAVQKGIVYATAREYGLWIVDASNPVAPRIRSRFDCCELATGVDVAGDVCFVGQRQNGVEFIDVSNPDDPRHIAMRKTDESQSVKYRNGWLYSGDWGSGHLTVFDAHDMRAIRQTDHVPLWGFGDGVWLQGDYLYAGTGHHAKHRKVSSAYMTEEMRRFGETVQGAGMGHGFDVFEVRDPAHPKRVGRVDFPPLYTRGNDFWTTRTSGGICFSAQTHNGVFATDISNPENPKVLDRVVFPDSAHTNLASRCVSSIAVGDGVVYASVKDRGVFAIPCERAKAEPFDLGVLPKNASFRETYSVDETEWHVWRPNQVGQARGVAVEGDLIYAACGDAGLHVLKVLPDNAGLSPVGSLKGHGGVYDVKFEDGLVYTAEGADGFGVYRHEGVFGFREIARLPRIDEKRTLALYVQPAGEGCLFCSDRHGVDLYDTTALPELRHVLHAGTCPGWDKYLADAPVGGGRHFAYNNAHSNVIWFDLKANPPVVSCQTSPKNRLLLTCGLCAFRGERLLATAEGKYVFLEPNQGDGPAGREKWTFVDLPSSGGKAVSGIPRSDGTNVVLTCRIGRTAALYDFSDPTAPKFRKKWKFSGNPDLAAFCRGKVVIPCGYAGVLLQR